MAAGGGSQAFAANARILRLARGLARQKNYSPLPRKVLGSCAVEGREAKCAKAEDSLGAATSPGWSPGHSR
jgi:hypothetical protein